MQVVRARIYTYAWSQTECGDKVLKFTKTLGSYRLHPHRLAFKPSSSFLEFCIIFKSTGAQISSEPKWYSKNTLHHLNSNYFYPIFLVFHQLSSKIFETFFTAGKTVLPKSAALGNATAHQPLLSLLPSHPFLYTWNALSVLVLQYCTALT